MSITTASSNERGEQGKLRSAIDGVRSKQAESIVAFRAAERAFAVAEAAHGQRLDGLHRQRDRQRGEREQERDRRRRYGTHGRQPRHRQRARAVDDRPLVPRRRRRRLHRDHRPRRPRWAGRSASRPRRARPAMSTITFDDPDMDFDPRAVAQLVRARGHVRGRQLDALRRLDGRAGDRARGRRVELQPLGRVWSVSHTDANTYWQMRVMVGQPTANRPAETDVERMQWLLATNEVAWALDDDDLRLDGGPGGDGRLRLPRADARRRSWTTAPRRAATELVRLDRHAGRRPHGHGLVRARRLGRP